MNLLISFVMFAVGLVLIIKGADFLVDGAASFAKKLGISELIIGLTIISMGTSAPELIVNLIAGMQGKSEIVLGNVIGSNICNILLILGISALLMPLTVQKSTVWKELPISLLATLLLFLFVNFQIGEETATINRWESGILLFCFLLFLLYIFHLNKNSTTEKQEPKISSPIMIAGFILLGFAGLFIGGKLTVDGAVSIAKQLGVSEKLIALTIVSIGTSLPELATSVVAALKKQPDIAVGNVIGSNIFNVLFILGIGGLVSPIAFQKVLNFDLIVLLSITGVLFLFMFLGKKHKIDRYEGGIMLSLFLIYLGYVIFRG